MNEYSKILKIDNQYLGTRKWTVQNSRELQMEFADASVEDKMALYEAILEAEQFEPKSWIMKPNTKLTPKRKQKKFALCNVDTAIGCVNRCGNCSLGNECYAFKGERFPNTSKNHMAKALWFNKSSAEEIAEEIRANNVEVLRINESGDFVNLEQVEKALKIAELCPNVLVYTYSKSRFALEIFNDLKTIEKYPNFICIDSLDEYENLTSFIVVDSIEDVPKGEPVCFGHCPSCLQCMSKRYTRIYVVKH